MRFALKQKGVPAEVTDHLDLKAHADPKLSARENIDNFLESHGLADYSDREMRSMAEQAEDEGFESEVRRRVDERIAEITAEIKAEGCAECNTQLRALEARLKRRNLKGERRPRRGVARKRKMSAKARKAALRNLRKARAAQRPRRRRSARRAARAQRRTVRRMARKAKRSYHKKQKAPIVRTIAKVAIIADGARRVTQPGTADKVKFWATHPSQILKDPRALLRDLGDQGIGVLEITLGPKGVNEVYKAIPAPEIKRIEVAGHKAV